MIVCASCKFGLDELTRFCPNCGTSVDSLPDLGHEATPSGCLSCGIELHYGARFCPSCGATTEESDQFSVAQMVAVLQAHTTPGSIAVLVSHPLKRPARRLQIHAVSAGTFGPQDAMRLSVLLSELIVWDGYLHCEVATGNRVVSCVWHVINGGVYPLAADHAAAVLDYYPSLLAANCTSGEIGAVGDAMGIM